MRRIQQVGGSEENEKIRGLIRVFIRGKKKKHDRGKGMRWEFAIKRNNMKEDKLR